MGNIPYIPYNRERVETLLQDAREYIADAASVLEDMIPRDLYCFVSDSDIALFAVVLATQPQMAEEIARSITGQIFAWLDSR
jgi:spermidine synthase